MSLVFDDHAVVLLQGDSITDAGRDRADPAGMGGGYAFMASSWLAAAFPEKRLKFLNRGNSGDRAKDLEARWKADCLDLRPAWVSIMIGINDTWRRFDSNDPTSTEAYERAYRSLLASARKERNARFILLEPFVLPVPEDRKAWRTDLDPRLHVVRTLAREFDAILVPLDGIFAAAAARREPAYWAADGVHPTAAGHALIAQAWLSAVGA